MIGDKITIADFHVCSIIFAHVHNDHYIGGNAFTDKGKAVIAECQIFADYIERMRQQLSDYLEQRPECPLW